jgi:hypothetical protein
MKDKRALASLTWVKGYPGGTPAGKGGIALADNHKTRGAIKFVVWTIASVAMIYFVFHSYNSGQMVRWYYYQTKVDGYAINVNSFKDATKERPAVLEIQPGAQKIEGRVAVPVKKGDRLPEGANGVIDKKVLEAGKRAKVEGDKLIVLVPWEIKESKGFKYKDTFIHKGVETNPWSGVWNVAVVIALGFSLGLMAEGLTDMLGWKIKKIDHYGH